ncbi:HEAT repeat containing protein [Theileria orientalis]|uniref:HEAT repeat containing protein n=1 Tax=Theileria orientalis TaxID=68886 RepID=A0A976QX53_THEOR|nr:HEAT repeat containing protein [Theileria orientalis]
MNEQDRHEFIPDHVTIQIVDFNPEFRKKGLVAIDVAVKNYVRTVESQKNEESDRDSTIDETVKRFFEYVKKKYLDQPDPNYRIGGLMAMACAALALDKTLIRYSQNFIKQVLLSFYDQDIKVRYYACESLYNIIKKCKFESLSCVDEIFDGICKLICDVDEDVKYASQMLNRLLCGIILEFDDIPMDLITDMLANRIFVINPFIRHLIYLPKVFLGLSNMLTDTNKDVRNAAESCLNDFLNIFKKKYSRTQLINDELFKVILLNCKRTEHEIKMPNVVWMKEISAIQPQIIHFRGFYQFLDFIIVSLEDVNEEINKMASEANRLLYENVNTVKSLSHVDQISKALTQRILESQNEQVILSVLDWFCLMLEISPGKMDSLCGFLSKSVISCFKQSHSQPIMESTLKTFFMLISMSDKHFEMLAVQLLELFKNEKNLLEESGRVIVLNLCKQVGFERFYTIITNSMKLSNDSQFLNSMVHNLNWTLLTSTEAQEFRNELLTQEKRNLADQLQEIWSFNLSSALSFALWTEKYDLAEEIVNNISTSTLNVDFLVNLDQIVQLLDTHIFIRLRLHLLKPDVYPSLLKSLLGLSMILPQNETNRNLMRRLNISQLTLLGQQLRM